MKGLNENKSYLILHNYLKLMGIRISSQTIKDITNKHPMKDTVRAVSDTLDELKVTHITANLSCDQLKEVELPLLGVFYFEQDPFCIITKCNVDGFEVKSASSKRAILPLDIFNRHWSGVVVGVEKSTNCFQENKISYIIKQGISWVERNIFTSMTALSFLLLCFAIQNKGIIPYSEYLAYGLKIAGIIVSFIIVYKTYFNANLLHKICKIGDVVDCNDILHSKIAKIFKWIGFGEISLAYFYSTLCWGLLFTDEPAWVYKICSLSACGFTVFSVIWQGFVAKKWCLLCMIVNLIIILELFVVSQINRMQDDLVLDFLVLGVVFLFSLLALVLIKEYLLKEQTLEILEFKNSNLLSKSSIFNIIINQTKTIDDATPYMPIEKLFASSDNNILIITNPFCAKCKKLHFDIDAIINSHNIQLLFTHFNNDEKGREVALKLISIYLTKGWQAAYALLDEWFSTEQIDSDINIVDQAYTVLHNHKMYCDQIHLQGTPFIAISNHVFPSDIYDIKDLRYIL